MVGFRVIVPEPLYSKTAHQTRLMRAQVKDIARSRKPRSGNHFITSSLVYDRCILLVHKLKGISLVFRLYFVVREKKHFAHIGYNVGINVELSTENLSPVNNVFY